jgi:hypothetical protein
MKLSITADNYEEIMFRLVEDDFDEATRKDLLDQIAADPLFRFEWESWQKTVFADPIENYAAEGSALAETIIQIAEPRINRKRVYYYLAAASVAVFLVSWFLLNIPFNPDTKTKVVESVKNPKVNPEALIQHETKQKSTTSVSEKCQNEDQMSQIETFPMGNDTSEITNENIFAEIPILIDSVPVKVITLAETPAKNSRYSVMVETTSLADDNPQKYNIALNRKVKFDKVLTNPRIYILRKPNGEPDRLVVMGEDDNYLCLKLNYVEK